MKIKDLTVFTIRVTGTYLPSFSSADRTGGNEWAFAQTWCLARFDFSISEDFDLSVI